MGHPHAYCPGHCPSASCLLPHTALSSLPHTFQFLLPCLPPLLHHPLIRSPSFSLPLFPLLFLHLLCLLPFPLLLPCPRGSAQRVVKVNLGSSTWSPRNKASPPAQGLSRDLINLHEPSIGADISRTEATLRGEGALGSGHLAPSSHMATPRCAVGRRQRRRKEK